MRLPRISTTRRHQHRAHHEVLVLREDGVEREASEARPRKDDLGDERARHERAERVAEQRDHRVQRVPQRVLVDDHALVEALGSRGRHVVEPQHVEQVAAHLPHAARQRNETDDQRRQREVPAAGRAPCRAPSSSS